MTISEFIHNLANCEVPENVFNQYSYRLSENQIQRENLESYLYAMQAMKPKYILVGEAPGYKGCKLTGVPFTSEYIILNNFPSFLGKKYSIASVGKPQKEATATMLWSTLNRLDFYPLLWNAFPYHPHKPNMPNTNRRPAQSELSIGQSYLADLIEIFDIKKIIAIGNVADKTLNNLGFKINAKLRHPSMGGKKYFEKGILSINKQS